jgi:carboxypeptidase family protein
MQSRRSVLARMAAGEDIGIARAYLKPAEPEIILRGTVTDSRSEPVRQAVITVIKAAGEPVDWGRSANDGAYSVVLPGAGQYVIITSADGWAPPSTVLELTADPAAERIVLTRPLTLAGRVTQTGRPLSDAPVWVTKPSGEVVVNTRTDDFGTYSVPLPPIGRYLITALDRDTDSTTTRQIAAVSESMTPDVEIVAAG